MKRIEEDAARWFARMQGAAPDHPDRGRFEAWLMADPAHAAEYAAFADIWNDLRPGSGGGEALAEAMKRRFERRHLERRKLIKRGVAGLLAAGAGGEAVYALWQRQPQWQLACQTGTAQLARKTLQDGSTLTLSPDTELAVTYSRGERRVDLARGEAIFEVAREPERAFVVEAGAARVTVLGTRFVVNRLSSGIRVSVDHGRVRVEAGPFWRRQRTVLEAGRVAELSLRQDGSAGALEPVSRKAADAFAFERGLLVFDNADLAEIAETLSRYRQQPVRVAQNGSGTAAPRIVAGIQANDIEGFIDLLPRLGPIEVRRERDGVWLRAR